MMEANAYLDEVRLALLAMGYRKARPSKWAKPVGYHLFTFNEEKMEWANWFRSMDGQILAYERRHFPASADYDPGRHIRHLTPLRRLKECEAWSRTDVASESGSEFQLSSFSEFQLPDF
jgi:hypothetical protein